MEPREESRYLVKAQREAINHSPFRKFENRKGLALIRLIIMRKMHGVSDGYLRTHPGKPFSSANLQGVVAEL
jgi:hypothetical protein